MNKFLLGVATSALFAGVSVGGALAADPVMTPTPVYNSATFDWDGFYMGIGISGITWDPASPSYGFIDVIAGVNITSDQVLFGLEGWVSGFSDGGGTSGFSGGAEGRIGYLVTPDVLMYLSGGGVLFDAGGQYATVGAGAEFAVSDSLSLDLEYKYWGWSNTGFTGHSVGASLNWHF